MIQRVTLVFFTVIMIAKFSWSQSLSMSFTTVPITSGAAAEYNPKHILAVWIETSNAKFVSSVAVYASERIGYLYNWNANSLSNKVNAVTGATLKSHTSHTFTWDCTTYNGSAIDDGDYLLCIELTSGDTHGTYSENPFNINSGVLSYTASGSNITELTLTYTPQNTNDIVNTEYQNTCVVMPNPVNNFTYLKFYSNSNALFTLDIVNQSGQKLHSIQGHSIVGDNQIFLDLSSTKAFSKGLYYGILTTGDYTTSVKIIKE